MKSLQRLTLCLGILLLALISLASNAHAATSLSKFAVGTLEFSLNQLDSTRFRITLHPEGGVASLSHDLTANVFAISGPSRLVIDVPGFSFGVTKEDQLSHQILQGIRVGSHPDKTRFVIDIANDAKPNYQVRTDIESESIVISFEIDSATTAVQGSEKNSRLTSKQATSTVKDAPAQTSEAQTSEAKSSNNATVGDADTLLLEAIRAAQDSKNSETKDKKATTTANETETSEETTTAAQAPTSDTVADNSTQASASASQAPPQAPPQAAKKANTASEGTVVTAIQFMQWPANNSGAVVIEVSNPEEYQLLPQGEDRYELRLDNAKLGASHLVIPQFPPEDFREFDVVMARQTGNTVVIQVYITKGVKLYPAKVDDRIWLKTSE